MIFSKSKSRKSQNKKKKDSVLFRIWERYYISIKEINLRQWIVLRTLRTESKPLDFFIQIHFTYFFCTRLVSKLKEWLRASCLESEIPLKVTFLFQSLLPILSFLPITSPLGSQEVDIKNLSFFKLGYTIYFLHFFKRS